MKKALSFVLILSIVFPAMAMNELYDQISHECEVIHVPMLEELKKIPNYFAGRFSYLFKRAETLANTYPEVSEKVTDTFSSGAFVGDNIFLEPQSTVDMLQVCEEAKENLEPVAASVAQMYQKIEENAGPASQALVRGVSRMYKGAETLANTYPDVRDKVIDTFSSGDFVVDNILSEPKNTIDMLQVCKEGKKCLAPVADALVRGTSSVYKSIETIANANPEVMEKVTDAFTHSDFENNNIFSESINSSVSTITQVIEEGKKSVGVIASTIPSIGSDAVTTGVNTTSDVTKESLRSGAFGFFVNKLQTKPALMVGVVVGSYITYRLGKAAYKKFKGINS